jgi:CheY-like chemotaxis protein
MAKVLLADDSVTIQKVVELVLSEEGFEIKAVKNGEEALSAVYDFKPDIVLADIKMPGINGYELAEKIKSNPETKDIPVILLAGAFEPLDEERAKNSGANDSLVKPFESEDLLNKINTLIGTKKEEMPAEEEPVTEEVPAEEEILDIESLTEVGPEEALEAEVLEEVSEEAIEAALPEVSVEEEEAKEEKPAERPEEIKLQMPDTETLSNIFKEAVNEKLPELLKDIDLTDIVFEALTQTIKDSVEKVLWEVAPEVTEKLLKEAVKDTMNSLTKELENIIWETVPELAESIIRKEIEKIRAES